MGNPGLGTTLHDMSTVRFGSSQGRWVIAGASLGSGIAFLDGSIVNATLPSIERDLHASLAGQQWVVTSYLLTLGSLLVVGGSLGDRHGRRKMFMVGLSVFSAASLACGLAPNLPVLISARIIKGIGAALLVPGSLAMLSSVFHPDDRAKAIGRWSGLSSVSTALGPFLGGWLIDSVSWRWVFLINPILAAGAIAIALRCTPETWGDTTTRLDLPGAVALSLGLAGVVYALIEGPSQRWSNLAIVAAAVGVSALIIFAAIEARSKHPMVPLALFRNRVFAGSTAATFVIWGALGAVFFLLTIHLQNDLRYSALEAGAAGLPVTILMFLFASRSGALAQRIGARAPLVVGPLTIAAGFAVLSTVRAGTSYLRSTFPGVMVFALGLVITVAPLTATVLGAVDDQFAGIGSAINNAVARIASLLAIATLPALAGISGKKSDLGAGFDRAMWICAGFALIGAFICALTIPGKPSASAENLDGSLQPAQRFE
jgi:EmrB/QacA subfamily drug resistance transporter